MGARKNVHSDPERALRVGPVQVLSLAWPVMVSLLSQTAMTMADVLYVSRLGTTPLAGIGLGTVAAYLLVSAAFGLTGGVRVLVAQATGAGRHRQARVLAWQGLWLAAAVGLVGLVLAPVAHPLARVFGASPQVADQGARYLAWCLGGTGATVATLALTSWFQGRGDTRTPMVVAVLSNLLNIAMDPVFIFGFGPIPALGIAGAAATTILAQVLSALVLALLVRRHLRGISAPSAAGPAAPGVAGGRSHGAERRALGGRLCRLRGHPGASRGRAPRRACDRDAHRQRQLPPRTRGG